MKENDILKIKKEQDIRRRVKSERKTGEKGIDDIKMKDEDEATVRSTFLFLIHVYL